MRAKHARESMQGFLVMQSVLARDFSGTATMHWWNDQRHDSGDWGGGGGKPNNNKKNEN